jgi:PilZ domain
MTEGPDKRKAERVQPFVVRCLIADGARRLPGYLTDLSATGAQVTVEGEPPAAGASVVVEVRLGRGAEATAHRLPAIVQWARGEKPPPPPSFGVTFQITEDERRAIEAVLADVRRRASQI